MEVNLIVAIGKNGEIGKNGDLIWKISEDLKRFKSLTTGHPVIMGRKTWESLPKKPLPNRRNIILSRQSDFQVQGGEVVNSVEEALRITKDESPFIIGGAEIYNAFLPYVTSFFLTEVEDSCDDADSYLKIDFSHGFSLEEETSYFSTPENVSYRYVTYKRLK